MCFQASRCCHIVTCPRLCRHDNVSGLGVSDSHHHRCQPAKSDNSASSNIKTMLRKDPEQWTSLEFESGQVYYILFATLAVIFILQKFSAFRQEERAVGCV